MKKRIGIAAVCLAAGCAAVLSGCAGATQNVAYLSSNWYANTAFKKFQPTFIKNDPEYKTGEKVIYNLKFDGSKATNTTYSVNYGDGSYTTEFYAETISRNSERIHSDFKDGYPEGGLTVYYYKTELKTGAVKFKVDKEEKIFENGCSKVTESYFLSVEDRLRPVYSKQTINSVSPAVLQATSLESSYVEENYVYETYYSYDGNVALTVTDNGKDKTTKRTDGLNGSQNTLFDIAYIDVAVRACKLSASLSQQISLYTPHAGIIDYTLSGVARALTETENKEISAELKDNGLYVPEFTEGENGEKVEKGLATVAVSANYNSQLTGGSQTFWFAAIDNARNNTGRATLVKTEIPVPFNLGAITCTLSDVFSTLWDGKTTA